jgi:RND family efflux transporter MFP subunit
MSELNARDADLSALQINREHKGSVPGRWKRWLHLLWLFVPVILYFVYQVTVATVKPSVEVQTARVQIITGSEAAAELVATGYVVAQVKAEVASKGTGRLKKLNVVEGDSVREGQILGELENDDVSANLELARANLKSVRADSVQSILNLNRQQKLFEAGHITEETIESATASYNKAVAEVEAMKASVRAAEVAVENTFIRAPFDGTVLSKQADVGEMVAPFASAVSSKGSVVTLADMKSLQVEADVSESNIDKVKIGQPCEIILDAYPGQKYPGHVAKIVPTADRTRATVLTKVAFNDIDSRVLPEMSARVNFLPLNNENAAESKPAKVVPKSALTMRNEKPVVFRISDGTAEAVPVVVGRQLGEFTEILSGLEPEDQVILSPAGGLSTGEKVEIAK